MLSEGSVTSSSFTVRENVRRKSACFSAGGKIRMLFALGVQSTGCWGEGVFVSYSWGTPTRVGDKNFVFGPVPRIFVRGFLGFETGL